MNSITEKTLLPLSLVIVTLGGIFWVSNLYFTGQANAAAIGKLEHQVDQKSYRDEAFQRLALERLARIEEKISKLK